MITSARIAALNQQEDGTARPDPTALYFRDFCVRVSGF
jgi:hypothetical protein